MVRAISSFFLKPTDFVHLLGLCLLLGTVSIVLDLGSFHSSGSSASDDIRRILTHDLDRPEISDLPSYRATPYKSRERKKLDFFVAGFPKCGTTTLLYAFASHNETDISKTEKCFIINSQMSDVAATHQLDDALIDLEQDSNIRRGIKCPSGIKNSRSLERIQNHSPRAKLIIGVRHPVLYFQSFYNYRVTEIHDRGSTENIPPIESLIGKKEWKGVSTDTARFDLYLMQLGKTNITKNQLQELVGRPQMSVKPNSFKIFLYSLDQMEDSVEERQFAWQKTLQDFMELEHPFSPIGHENLNHFVGVNSHNETINICESRYDALRDLLIDHGRHMEKWIRNEFIRSKDVVVANEKHFLESISSWKSDPCPKVLDQKKIKKRRRLALKSS